jgi:phospholipase/carboxylesterase
MSYLPCVEIESQQRADSAVIWLHGLGADGHDFASLVPQLNFPKKVSTRFIFPHAPSMPVTINGGYIMPAWYDILEMSIDRKVDVVQLEKSAAEVAKLILREQERGVANQRIILAGFSQGGAVVYQAALSHAEPLGGLLVLSSYFATYQTIQAHPANQQIPILIQHGTQDNVVPEALGQRAVQLLSERGYHVDYQRYPMAHTLCAPQIDDINRWLGRVL